MDLKGFLYPRTNLLELFSEKTLYLFFGYLDLLKIITTILAFPKKHVRTD